jgi:cell wall-associated NlpC family hydrolase
MPYFEDQDKQDKLWEIIQSWIGTKHMHGCGVKQKGTDCLHFVLRVFEEMGFGPFKIPKYSPDWHQHKGDELLLKGLMTQSKMKLEQFKPENVTLMNGDLVTFRFGKATSHIGIYFEKGGDARIYHVPNSGRVYGMNISLISFSSRMTNVFKVIK